MQQPAERVDIIDRHHGSFDARCVKEWLASEAEQLRFAHQAFTRPEMVADQCHSDACSFGDIGHAKSSFTVGVDHLNCDRQDCVAC
jgi:hypothetical protein